MTTPNHPGAPVESGYAPVNGLAMYYEVHGDTQGGNPPLVLLHGNLSTIGTSFGKVLPALSAARRVIAVEQQGHGHTADIVRPEHVVAMFRLLGGGVIGDLAGLPRSQLAVLPGTTHVSLVDRAEWLSSMILAFLDAPVPAT